MQLEGYRRYLEAERGLSPYTVRNYAGDVARFLQFLKEEGVEQVEAADHHLIRAYLAHLHREGVSPRSVVRKLSSLRSFFRYLERRGELPENPMARVSTPKQGRPLPSFLTAEETLALLGAPDLATPLGMRDRAILELLYATGMRLSEMAWLDLEDVDLGRGEIRVRGKRGKERIVLMGHPAAAALERYLSLARPRLARGRRTPALFLNRYGGRLSARYIERLVAGYARRAGIDKKVHPHLLRHTFATHMLDGGADLRVVQELLGHVSPTTTQVYTHLTRAQMRRRYLDAHPRSTGERELPTSGGETKA